MALDCLSNARFAVPLGAVLRGARAALSDDDALLAEAGRLFEYLYAHYATGT